MQAVHSIPRGLIGSDYNLKVLPRGNGSGASPLRRPAVPVVDGAGHNRG